MLVKGFSAGLEPPEAARNRRKATVKIRRNTARGFIQIDLENVLVQTKLHLTNRLFES